MNGNLLHNFSLWMAPNIWKITIADEYWKNEWLGENIIK